MHIIYKHRIETMLHFVKQQTPIGKKTVPASAYRITTARQCASNFQRMVAELCLQILSYNSKTNIERVLWSTPSLRRLPLQVRKATHPNSLTRSFSIAENTTARHSSRFWLWMILRQVFFHLSPLESWRRLLHEHKD